MKFTFKSLFRKKQAEDNKPKEIKDYYDIAPIDNTGAAYRMIMGQRSMVRLIASLSILQRTISFLAAVPPM